MLFQSNTLKVITADSRLQSKISYYDYSITPKD